MPELTIADFKCASCKTIVVDGDIIAPFKARDFLIAIKPKDIQFIVSYPTANPQIYGSNAVNGLTEIFLKQKTKGRFNK